MRPGYSAYPQLEGINMTVTAQDLRNQIVERFAKGLDLGGVGLAKGDAAGLESLVVIEFAKALDRMLVMTDELADQIASTDPRPQRRAL